MNGEKYQDMFNIEYLKCQIRFIWYLIYFKYCLKNIKDKTTNFFPHCISFLTIISLIFRSSIRGSRRLQNTNGSHRSSFVRRPWNQAVMEAASKAQAANKINLSDVASSRPNTTHLDSGKPFYYDKIQTSNYCYKMR